MYPPIHQAQLNYLYIFSPDRFISSVLSAFVPSNHIEWILCYYGLEVKESKLLQSLTVMIQYLDFNTDTRAQGLST